LWSGGDDGTASVLAEVDGELATVALAATGNYLLAVDQDLVLLDPRTNTTGVPVRLAADGTRCTDGAVDAAGRFRIVR